VSPITPQDEYAGGTSLESLEALVRSRMDLDPSLGVGLRGGPDAALSLAPAPAASPAGDLRFRSPAAAAARVSPQRERLWLEFDSPTGPVPMSLAGGVSVCSRHLVSKHRADWALL
jgi:hypothetical protein